MLSRKQSNSVWSQRRSAKWKRSVVGKRNVNGLRKRPDRRLHRRIKDESRRRPIARVYGKKILRKQEQIDLNISGVQTDDNFTSAER